MVCTTNLTPKASHTVKCRESGDMISRHNAIRDIIANLASTACLAPIREKAGLLGDVPGQRPADIFIPNMFNNTPCAIDVAVTSTNAEIYARDIKHKKYDDGFKGTGIEFIAAVVDTFGQWSEEGHTILNSYLVHSKSTMQECASTEH